MLKLHSLTKTFKKKDNKTKEVSEVGIRDISLTAEHGRIFGLIGANGAGKTTTMRIIAGLTYPNSGYIEYDNTKYSEINNLKEKVAFVSGETGLYDRFTPYRIFSLFGELSGLSKSEINNRIDELTHSLEMEDYLHLKCATFSTGMRQRVSIARALLTDPQILVFDEITNGLDIFASKAIKNIVLDLKAKDRIILYSTHIMPDADALCDDVAILHEGSIIENDTADNLRKKYSTNLLEEVFFNSVKKKHELSL